MPRKDRLRRFGKDWLEESTQHGWVSIFVWFGGGALGLLLLPLLLDVSDVTPVREYVGAFVAGLVCVAAFYALRAPAARLHREKKWYKEQLDRMLGVFREADWRRDFLYYQVELARPFMDCAQKLFFHFAEDKGVNFDLNKHLDEASPSFEGSSARVKGSVPPSTINASIVLIGFAAAVYRDGMKTVGQFFDNSTCNKNVTREEFELFDTLRMSIKKYFGDCTVHRQIGSEDYDKFLRDTVGKRHTNVGILLSYLESQRAKAMFGSFSTEIGGMTETDWYSMVRWLWKPSAIRAPEFS